jgi:hypothetical protein
MTMVNIHSMAASSHPSRHEREAEGGATSSPRAGQSRCSGSRLGATTVIVESQPQHTAGMAVPPPVAAGTDATLQMARQLLNNPPLSEASPSAVEQWRHDVDQLVVAAINTPPHERRHPPSMRYSRILSVVRAPSSARVPPVARASMVSYAMADLRAEINRRHGGEDSRITIERLCERRRDVEGRNL